MCSCNASGTASAAISRIGDEGWGPLGLSGGLGWIGNFKCNLLVNTATKEGGSTPPLVNNRQATAGELANQKQVIDSWSVVHDSPQSGDIISIGEDGHGYSGHTGIVVIKPSGKPATVSANSEKGTVTLSDWGFRQGQYPTPRRCTCK